MKSITSKGVRVTLTAVEEDADSAGAVEPEVSDLMTADRLDGSTGQEGEDGEDE